MPRNRFHHGLALFDLDLTSPQHHSPSLNLKPQPQPHSFSASLPQPVSTVILITSSSSVYVKVGLQQSFRWTSNHQAWRGSARHPSPTLPGLSTSQPATSITDKMTNKPGEAQMPPQPNVNTLEGSFAGSSSRQPKRAGSPLPAANHPCKIRKSSGMAAAPTTSSSAPFRFGDLPRELVDHICKFVSNTINLCPKGSTLNSL